jgi:hypothetical protein
MSSAATCTAVLARVLPDAKSTSQFPRSTSMADPTTNVAQEGDNSNSPLKRKPQGPLGWLLVILLFPIMLGVEAAGGLRKKVYNSGYGGGFREILGIVFGLAAGIGAGYYLGWMLDHSWYSWLLAGVATAAATYIYVWPLAYLAVIKSLVRLSTELWDAVPNEREDAWFSTLLTIVARFSVVGFAVWQGWHSMLSAQAHLAVNIGFFAWPLALAWGFVLALIIGAFGWLISSQVIGIAIASGALLGYGLLPLNESILAGYGIVNPAVSIAASVVEALLFVAYVFPLGHVIASHGLRFVRNLVQKAYKQAYTEKLGHYEGVFVQIANFYTAYHLAVLSLVGAALLGVVLSGWLAIAVPVVVALLAYLYVGEVLKAAENRGLGVLASAHAAWFTYLWYVSAGLWQGIIGGIVAGALAATLTYYLVYPVLYVVVRFFARFVLNNELAGKLVDLHKLAVDRFQLFWTEIARARKIAYTDSTPFARIFLHVLNLVGVVAAFHYSSLFVAAVGTSPLWLAWALVALAVVVSYFLVGKLLLWLEIPLVGTIAAILAALATGTIAYAGMAYGLWVAVPVGLLAGVLAFLWVFPVLYVLVRFIANLIDGLVPVFSKLVEPVLSGIFNFLWNGIAAARDMIVNSYRVARDWFRPIWASFKESWNGAWQYVKDTWDSMKSSRR